MAWTYPPLEPGVIADILRRYRPRGWRVCQSRYRRDHGGNGVADSNLQVLRVPILADADDLHTFLHECGHVHRGHFLVDNPHHLEEHEAEMYALHVLWAEGIETPRLLIRTSRCIIADAIAKDVLKDIPIDWRAQAWAEKGIMAFWRHK